MPKTCLIIDDNPQDDIIERIQTKALNKQVMIECLQFNVGSQERRDLLTHEAIDIDKVIQQFEKEFDGKKIDLICIDYNLEDDNIDGLEILRKIYPLRGTSAYMLYSANLNQLASRIVDGYEVDKDKKKLLGKIKALTRFKIMDFVDRDDYDDTILKILSRNDQSMELYIEEKLLEYGELEFHNTYPIFEGKKLKEIAKEIRTRSLHGDRYVGELLEQAFSFMIKINNG